MYCRRCRYPLTHLTSSACPECGTPFDPDAPHTYLRSASRFTRILIALRLSRRRLLHLAIAAAVWISLLTFAWTQPVPPWWLGPLLHARLEPSLSPWLLAAVLSVGILCPVLKPRITTLLISAFSALTWWLLGFYASYLNV